jgi:hypothetical protein
MSDRQNGVQQPNIPRSDFHIPQSEEAEQRRARRLADDLGINSAGVQVVLRLRHVVVTLQARVRQLEGELRIERSRSEDRSARYMREYDEATWDDRE